MARTSIDTIQRRLETLGYLAGEITGDLDGETTDALRRFQEANGLFPDGLPDRVTFEMLFPEVGEVAPCRPDII